MGPMITRAARDRILELIEEARSKGAALVCGGTIPEGLEAGNFVTPALLRDVTEDMRVSREEIFGPIIKHKTQAICPCYGGWPAFCV